MNRKLTLIAAVTLGLASFATPVHADGGTISADATCSGLTVTIAGFPDGASGGVGIGANPPYATTGNVTGTYSIDGPNDAWHMTGDIGWQVWVNGDTPDEVKTVSGVLNCDPPPVAAVVEVRPPAADPIGPLAATEQFFGNYQLAPPEVA